MVIEHYSEEKFDLSYQVPALRRMEAAVSAFRRAWDLLNKLYFAESLQFKSGSDQILLAFFFLVIGFSIFAGLSKSCFAGTEMLLPISSNRVVWYRWLCKSNTSTWLVDHIPWRTTNLGQYAAL